MRLPKAITAWGSTNTVLPEAELSCTRPGNWLAAPALTANTGRPWRSETTLSCSRALWRRTRSCSRSRRSRRPSMSWRRRPSRGALARSAMRPPSSRQNSRRCSRSGSVRNVLSKAVHTGRSSGSSMARLNRRAAASVVATSRRDSPPAQPPLAQWATTPAISATPWKLKPAPPAAAVNPSRPSSSVVSASRTWLCSRLSGRGRARQARWPAVVLAKLANCSANRGHSNNPSASA